MEWVPGAPMNRENFMIFVLAISAWVAHAVAAGMVRRVDIIDHARASDM